MRSAHKPEICSGTYFPRRGSPRRGYYVLMGEVVVAGPFRTSKNAEAYAERLQAKKSKGSKGAQESAPTKHLDPAYARAITAVLRKQENVVSAKSAS